MRAIHAYLNFDGDCADAMRFYEQCFGGELSISTFRDVPDMPPGSEDRVMHARLTMGDALLMASDTMPGAPFSRGNDVWLSIHCESDAELARLHAALAQGGSDVMSPQDTFWNARFGMATDRFGVNWMLNHEKSG